MQDQIEELLTEQRFDISIAPQLEAYVDEQVRLFLFTAICFLVTVNWLDFLSFFRSVTWRIWLSDGRRQECTMQRAAGRMWMMGIASGADAEMDAGGQGHA